MISPDHLKEIKKSETELQDMIFSLRKFNTANNQFISPESVEDLLAEVDMLSKLKKEIRETYIEINAVAKLRNIKDNQNSKMPASDSMHTFNGECFPYHYHEFIEKINSYMEDNGIQNEEGGKLILSLCTGNAKDILNDAFPYQVNPDFEQVKQVLKNHFADKNKITNQLILEHNKLGAIPDQVHPSMIEEIYNQIMQHNKLISKMEMIRDGNDERENTVDYYTQTIINILPTKSRMELWDCGGNYTSESMFRRVAECFRTYKKVYRNQVTKGLRVTEIIEQNNFYEEPVNPSTFAATSSDYRHKFTVTEIETEDCPLCDHLAKRKIYPIHKKHLTINKTNHIIMESCPHLSKKESYDRSKMLEEIMFCSRCLSRPRDEKHSEETCFIIQKFPQLTCGVPDCSGRFSTCGKFGHNLVNHSKFIELSKILKKVK